MESTKLYTNNHILVLPSHFLKIKTHKNMHLLMKGIHMHLHIQTLHHIDNIVDKKKLKSSQNLKSLQLGFIWK